MPSTSMAATDTVFPSLDPARDVASVLTGGVPVYPVNPAALRSG
jgi:hypothetical protein